MDKHQIIEVEPVIVRPACIQRGDPQECRTCPEQERAVCISPRALCVKPYKNHPHGCPNYSKRKDCPPCVPMFDNVFDTSQSIYAIVSTYDLGRHIEKMRARHPSWTETQILNVLYWQEAAKKELRALIAKFNAEHRQQGYYATTSPEAMGVDVTETLKRAGIELEWPARQTIRKVAFAGIPYDDTCMDILL